MSNPLKVFITYAHKNAEAKDKLITYLAVMKRDGLIDIWHDNEILPGDKWRDTIFNNLADSDLLLYLTSAHSLESENCNEELAAALNAEIRVIPIILESCDWLSHQLSDFQALPDKGKAITKVDNAITDYTTAIRLNPNNAEAYFYRGNNYHNKGEVDRAIEDFNKAIKIKSDYAKAYFNRGIGYQLRGEIDNAIKDYTMAIKFNPYDAKIYINRGGVYNFRGDFNKAFEDFNKAVELDPHNPLAYNNRGNAYIQKGDFENAINDLTQVIQLSPNSYQIYINRAMLWLYMRKWEKAKSDLTTAKNMGVDTIALFRNTYTSVEDFTQKTGIQLPEDIAALLTPPQA